MITFGGFISNWDIGTISDFVTQADPKRRFDQNNGEGEVCSSKVRTSLIVSIFFIGCALVVLSFRN